MQQRSDTTKRATKVEQSAVTVYTDIYFCLREYDGGEVSAVFITIRLLVGCCRSNEWFVCCAGVRVYTTPKNKCKHEAYEVINVQNTVYYRFDKICVFCIKKRFRSATTVDTLSARSDFLYSEQVLEYLV